MLLQIHILKNRSMLVYNICLLTKTISRHLDLGHTHIDNGHSHPDAGHVHYYDESDERGGDWYLR